MVNFVLDLDETLIHTMDVFSEKNSAMEKKSDFNFKLDNHYYYVLTRPGYKMFLEFLFKYFKVGIWTAADKEYAKHICKRVLTDSQLKKIEFIYSRGFCHIDHASGSYTKPLTKIYSKHPSFKPHNTIMVDNTHHVMKYNLQNSIHIPDFNLKSNKDYYLYHIRNIIIQYFKKVKMNDKTPVFGMVYDINKFLKKYSCEDMFTY
jgi:TFIIF-interacting CTD phosphatase-like protein